MLKTIQKHVVLWVQSKTGVTLVFLIAMTFAATAILMMFVFLCVAAYAWASVELGPVFAISKKTPAVARPPLIGAAVSVAVRRQTRERAVRVESGRKTRLTIASRGGRFQVLSTARVGMVARR